MTIGDLVKLQSGGRVPADVRVLVSDGLKVDLSSFTGPCVWYSSIAMPWSVMSGHGRLIDQFDCHAYGLLGLTLHTLVSIDFVPPQQQQGESLPVELIPDTTTDAAHALHARNVAFSSALVVEGTSCGYGFNNSRLGFLLFKCISPFVYPSNDSTINIALILTIRSFHRLSQAKGWAWWSASGTPP